MDRIVEWWRNKSNGARALLAACVILAVAVAVLGVFAASQSSALSDATESLSDTEANVSSLETSNDNLSTSLDQARADRDVARARTNELAQQVSDLTARISVLENNNEKDEENVARLSRERNDAQRELRETQRQAEDLAEVVAQLSITYDDELDASRRRLESAAVAHACSWGEAQAEEGSSYESVTGLRAFRAFVESDEYVALVEDPTILSYMRMSEVLDADGMAIGEQPLHDAATECWQRADERINADLYRHQDTLRAAVLDAACTHGAQRAERNYLWTAEYQAWALDNDGKINTVEYFDTIRDRFGSVVAFTAVTEDELQASDERCEEIRDLIEPKYDGTWNVGTEIKAGTWVAYDESDCYWARLAVNGGIRDNHFGDGLRISARVASSDGQFEISGCDFYYLNP